MPSTAPTEATAPDTFTAREVRAAIDSFSPEQWDWLERSARWLSRSLSDSTAWEDLLQESLVRAIDGSRKCPTSVKIGIFILGTMRSEAHRLRTKFVRAAELGDCDVLTTISRAVDPEHQAILVVDTARLIAVMEEECQRTQGLLDMLHWIYEDLSIGEMRVRYGTRQPDFDTLRRRFKRTANTVWASFPGYWS